MRRVIAVAAALLVFLTGSVPAAAGTEEGIQVHGHWKIEVFEPDGTLVSVTEFENAFIGFNFTIHVLLGGYSAGFWGILLDSMGGGAAPCTDGASFVPCLILEPADPHAGPDVFSNLSISQLSTTFTLSGFAEAANATSIDRVRTMAGFCGSDVAPDSCVTSAAFGGLGFTESILGEPVPVESGQIIQVTVTISFS